MTIPTVPPTEITDPAEWLRGWITTDRQAAEAALKVAPGEWHDNWGDQDEDDEDVYPVIFTDEQGELLRAEDGMRPVIDHLIRHEPRDVIARCDAELKLLDLYTHMLGWNDTYDQGVTEHEIRMMQAGAREMLRMLVQGYRHRPGYRPEWTS